MGWDNVQLNINGKSEDHLMEALQLVLSMHCTHGIKGYLKDPKKGLVLCWYAGTDGVTPFPTPLDAKQTFAIVKAYLGSEDADAIDLSDNSWDRDCDHDGHNSQGWRIYAEDWGHVKTRYAVCAVKKVFLWHGK